MEEVLTEITSSLTGLVVGVNLPDAAVPCPVQTPDSGLWWTKAFFGAKGKLNKNKIEKFTHALCDGLVRLTAGSQQSDL